MNKLKKKKKHETLENKPIRIPLQTSRRDALTEPKRKGQCKCSERGMLNNNHPGGKAGLHKMVV